MCNPAYILAVYQWNQQEKQLEDARDQATYFAQLKAEVAHQEHGEKLTHLSVRQSNDLRKAVSAQGLASVKMAARGITGGTAFSSAMMEYGMRSAELMGAFAVKERQAQRQYGSKLGGIGLEWEQQMKQYEATGIGGLMMNLAMAAVSTYMATGDFGILSGAPDVSALLGTYPGPTAEFFPAGLPPGGGGTPFVPFGGVVQPPTVLVPSPIGGGLDIMDPGTMFNWYGQPILT